MADPGDDVTLTEAERAAGALLDAKVRARMHGEHVAPWLVFLSGHLPEVNHFDGIPAIGCMCGATRTLYVGHLALMLADYSAARVASLTAKVEHVRGLHEVAIAAYDADVASLTADRDDAREALAAVTEGYRDAIGIPASEHQTRRLEAVASALEEMTADRDRLAELLRAVVSFVDVNHGDLPLGLLTSIRTEIGDPR